MSDNKLLAENTIRRFMKLANTLKLEAPAPPKPRQAPVKPDTPPANEEAETVADEEPKS